jgi:hypothetical protein
MSDISQNLLKQFLEYDPETGDWRWLKSTGKMIKEGDAAGTISVHGYRIITFLGTKYRASRLAFLYMTGSWPENEVDHINRCKLDDRWDNLRDVSRSENQLNRDMQSNNTSGARGVHWNTEKCKWCAQVKKDNITHHAGYFDSFEEAVAARDAAAIELHGDFAEQNTETLQ